MDDFTYKKIVILGNISIVLILFIAYLVSLSYYDQSNSILNSESFGNNAITGFAVNDKLMKHPYVPSYPEGEPTYTSIVTTVYYTPSYDDFNSWCSTLKGVCFLDILGIKEYYKNKGNSYVSKCIDDKNAGYCCIPENERGFYEEVKCQGSGVYNGKVYYYENIQPDKSTSPALQDLDSKFQGYKQGLTSQGTDPEPHRTIAVNPDKKSPCYIPYFADVYIDFGPENPWTGWYKAEDTGSAFKGRCKIDIFAGVGKDAKDDALPYVSGKNPKVWVYVDGKLWSPDKEIEADEGFPSLGYYVKANTRVRIDYDFSVYGYLSNKAKEIVNDCALSGDVSQCVNDKAQSFSGSNYEWYSGGCGDSYEDLFNSFTEYLDYCLANEGCICEVEIPDAMFIEKEQEIVYSIQGKYLDAVVSMDRPVRLVHKSDELEKLSIYYKERKNVPEIPIDILSLYVNYENNRVKRVKAETVTNTLSGVEVESIDDLNELYFMRDAGTDKLVVVKDPTGFNFCPEKRTYKFCVKDKAKKILVTDNNEFGKHELKYRFAVEVGDKIPPARVRGVNVDDTVNAELNITIRWQENAEPDVKEYLVYMSSQDFSDVSLQEVKKLVAIADDDDTDNNGYAVTVKVDKDSQDYYFAVTAVDYSGNEDKSVIAVKGNSIDDMPPSKVDYINYKKTGGVVEFTWSKPVKNKDETDLKDLAGFKLVFSESDSLFKSELNKDSLNNPYLIILDMPLNKVTCDNDNKCAVSYSIDDLPLDTGKNKYFFTVIAYDDNGNNYYGDVSYIIYYV